MNDRPLPPQSPWFWVVPLVAALALAGVWFGGVNRPLFLYLNHVSEYTGGALWANITAFGDTLMVFCLLLPFVNRRPLLVWGLVLTTLIGGLYVQGVKDLVHSARPPYVLAAGAFHLIGFRASSFSFPSGHSTAAAAVAAAICLLDFPVAAKWLALGAGLLVGFSRVAVGIHWPVDVLGGIVGGWLFTGLSLWLAHWWRWGLGRGGQRFCAVLLLLGAGMILSGNQLGYPQARITELVVAIGGIVLASPQLYALFRPARR